MWDKAPSTDALKAMLGGQLPGMTVSSAAAEAMQKSLENPLPPKHPLSTMRQNRVLDLYIGNLIAGTAIEPVKVLTQRPFLNFSELQLWDEGVSTISRHRDAVDVAVRESTRLVREPRQFRDCMIPRRSGSRAS